MASTVERLRLAADTLLKSAADRLAMPASGAGLIDPSAIERLRRRLPLLTAELAGLALLALVGLISLAAAALATLLVTLLTLFVPEMDGAASAQQATAAVEDMSWRDILDAVPDAVLVLDSARNVLHLTPAVVDLFPRARRGIALTHLLRNPELIEAAESAFARDQSVTVELKDRVPVTRTLAAIVTRLAGVESAGEPPAEDGRPALLIVFRDMTDQEKVAQMRADFVANASHELRTPLASLRGFVETLQGPARNDEASRDRFLAIMSTQASRMSRLIDDLLSLSRAEMQVHVPPRGVVDIPEVLSFVEQSLEPLAQANQTRLVLTLPDGPARVRGERDELVQVFQNLVQNGIKYGREGGRVEIALTREAPASGHGPRLSVSVKDDGQGIASVHIPRLTERFYRVNVTQSREKGGTGLGLAIVKYIVSRHRGELRITSEVGKGSTFLVVLDELCEPATTK